MEENLKLLSQNATMRDIFDFCIKFNLENLAQGMIELTPPYKLREKICNLCQKESSEIHMYRNRFGEDIFRIAIVNLLEKHYKIKVPKESILATSGVTGGIVSTLLMVLDQKQKLQKPFKVGLLSPFYTYHQKQISELCRVEPIYIEGNKDFSLNFENIEFSLKSGLDILLLTNPGNPQGTVLSKEKIQKLVLLTEQYNCILLIDEVYCDLVWKGEFYTPIQDKLYDHVIICRGFSKCLGAQSWRCGYAITSPSRALQLMQIHDPIYICVSWVQHGIAQYLMNDYEDFKNHINQIGNLIKNNWKILSLAFQKALGWEPIEPDGSMYGMFKHNQPSDWDAVLLGLKKGVGVAPGKIFWPNSPKNTGYVRIHCGISSEKAKKIVDILSQQNITN